MNKKVRILDPKYKALELEVEDMPSIVIAEDFDSALDLAEAVGELGYETYFSACSWPRDRFISMNDNYIPRRRRGRVMGEGGCFVFGQNYLIYSKEIYNPYAESYSKNIKELEERLKRFLGVAVYSVESYVWEDPEKNGPERHLDSTILTIPQKNILIVDNKHYRQSAGTFEKIAAAQKLELVIMPFRRPLSLNCLVLEDKGQPIVFADKKAKSLHRCLAELKIDYIPIKADEDLERLGGSIRCRTNYAANPLLFKMMGLKVNEEL